MSNANGLYRGPGATPDAGLPDPAGTAAAGPVPQGTAAGAVAPSQGEVAARKRRLRLRLSRRPRAPKQRLSAFLLEIAADESRERLSVADFLTLLKGRAIAALMLIFALPNAVPSPPGTSGILGVPLIYLAVQMMLGHRPWLPRFIADRSMSRTDFAAIVSRSVPFLARAERFLTPRMAVLTSPVGVRLIGGACLVLALVLILPIPLANMLPAIAIAALSLAVLERDGVWVIAGLLIGLLSLSVAWGVIFAFIKATIFLFTARIGVTQ